MAFRLLILCFAELVSASPVARCPSVFSPRTPPVEGVLSRGGTFWSQRARA